MNKKKPAGSGRAARGRRTCGARGRGGRPRCACSVCGRAFAERAALLRHARRHAPRGGSAPPAAPAPPADKPVKQMSLLVPDNQQMPTEVITEQQEGDSEDRVIYIAYDVEDSTPSLHILGHEQTVGFEDPKLHSGRELFGGSSLLVPQAGLEHLELEQLAEPLELEEVAQPTVANEHARHHLPVTDEHGNPLHFTMQDGTRLAITSADGKSLQVITQDGQTIPVEINSFTDDEDIDGPDTVVHQLNLQKSVESNGSTPVTHYYTLV
ncbi:unnamed protein product, partial [Iphiclides podalirius]